MNRSLRRLPRYVHGYIDRQGRPRYYLRRPGYKRVPLPGLPWSPEFMAAYEQALNAVHADHNKSVPGSLRALVASYFASHAYRGLNDYTQTEYRRILDRLCAEHGNRLMSTFRHEHVVALMADRKPEGANRLRKALRALMQHAIAMKLRQDDPTREVRSIKRKGDGYHSWTEEEIAALEERHPIGAMARLALALLLFTGQRRGDVICIGRQHVNAGLLFVRQQKTGVELFIPIHPTLAAIIDAMPRSDLTFLTAERGRPVHAQGFQPMVPQTLQRGRAPALLGTWAAQSRGTTLGGSGSDGQ